MTPLDPLPRAMLLVLALAAGAFDWRQRRIPNWLTAPFFAAALVVHLASGGLAGLSGSLTGASAGLAITLPFFLIRGLGGGDVKLFVAAGAITGAMNLVYLFLINAILGGLAAAVLVLVKGRVLGTLRNVGVILASLSRGRAPHELRPGLAIDHQDALTLPRGVIVAVTVLLLVASRQL